MIRVHRHGEVTRFEMSSAASRMVGYSASAYLVRGALVDCGFHGVRRSVAALLADIRPRGVLLTHHHEDHAGNAELVAGRAIPIAAGAETLERLRAPAPIRMYRRVTWRATPPLRSAVSPFDDADLSLVAAPGHSSDHHVVWDAREGTVFGGDLYLGVKVRIAHRGEDPRLLAHSLRAVAALGPARLFDAHRGFVTDPVPSLLAKADWLDEMVAAIERRIAHGAPDVAIVRELLGGESFAGWFSGGDYSRANLVRAVRRGRAGDTGR